MMNTRDVFTVYFIKPVGMDGPIKIGITEKVPERRLKECGSWSPFPLEIIGSAPGRWEDEQFLHACLAEHHSHGEWFRAAPMVLAAMNTVIAEQGFVKVRSHLTPTANIRSKNNRSGRIFNRSYAA
ncbi:GIY-YIG nuclease family protein [Bradyrhizobium sp. 197]|uniref:GIY-YIG nuclease family protein n=1 Tax=Bradyrhizobium sp. 197 TaxID=2782663 RepID=UPI001FF8FD56|nr:GIY-YIG nuclease family protein [Bradyrhizobium sp. 197]MCK1479302.1 GIY-YIG nuclease family protein [Bradyrhizobium sp. 197]